MSWQDQYENAAKEELLTYEALPVKTLLNAITDGQYGEYNMIWYVLAERATLQQAGWLLYQTLQRNVSYLIRCNCAEALLKLLGRTDVLAILNEAVALTAGTADERRPHLAVLERELMGRLGQTTG